MVLRCLGIVAFVVAVLGLVHSGEPGTRAAEAREPKGKQSEAASRRRPSDSLPPQVVEMRDAILAAAAAGDIEELRLALDWNELPPDVGAEPGADAIAHLRKISIDGQGREMLAALANILSVAPAVIPGGRDIENNRLFVWPYLAERPLGSLSPAQEVELYRLVPPAEAKAMTDKGRYSGWRLVVGADGTWHSFRRD